MRLRHVLSAAMVLGSLADLLACGSGSGREQVQKAADEARATLNGYCDARAKAIEALGTGEAGAGQ